MTRLQRLKLYLDYAFDLAWRCVEIVIGLSFAALLLAAAWWLIH